MSLSPENEALLRALPRDTSVKVFQLGFDELRLLLDAARLEGFRQAQDENSPMWKADHARLAATSTGHVSVLETIVGPKRNFVPPVEKK